MQHDNLVLFRERDQSFIKGVVRHRAHRIRRIGHDHEPGFARRLLRDVREIRQEIVLRVQGVRLNLCPCQLRPQRKYRVARVGDQDHVSRITEGDGDMGHSLLGSVKRHHLILLKLHPEPAPVKGLHGRQQLLPVRQGVFIILRIHGRLRHRLHNMRLRTEIRRSHGKIVHLPASRQKLCLFMVKNREDSLLDPLGPP